MWADYMHVNIHVLPILQILLFYKVIVPKDIHDMARHPYGQSPETTELLRKNVQTNVSRRTMHAFTLAWLCVQAGVCVVSFLCVCTHAYMSF